MRRWGFAVVLWFGASGAPALAQTVIYQSSAGDHFTMTCNRDGYVLTLVPDGDQIFMGRSCDAFAPRFGGGRWCLANAGTYVEVGQLPIAFPGQEPLCPGLGPSPFVCLC